MKCSRVRCRNWPPFRSLVAILITTKENIGPELNIEIPPEFALKLRPGMTAEVEILVDQISDPVTQVPLTAVVKTGGKYFVWAKFGDHFLRKEIVVGPSNDDTFVVEEGLTAQEEVVLHPFDHFLDEILELQKQYPNQPEMEWDETEIVEQDDNMPHSEEEFLQMIGVDDQQAVSHEEEEAVDSSVGE